MTTIPKQQQRRPNQHFDSGVLFTRLKRFLPAEIADRPVFLAAGQGDRLKLTRGKNGRRVGGTLDLVGWLHYDNAFKFALGEVAENACFAMGCSQLTISRGFKLSELSQV